MQHEEDGDIPWNTSPLPQEDIARIDSLLAYQSAQFEAEALLQEQQEYIKKTREEYEKDQEEKRFAHLKPGKWLKFTELIACDLPEPDQVVENLIDRGDKMLIVGHSKTKKTFLVTQLALSIATGSQFLGLQIPKARKVLLIQYEVQPGHFIRRIRRMADSLSVSIDDVQDRLTVINARGARPNLEILEKQIELENIEVVIFDPFYKLFEGDESDVEEVKRILATFDRIVTNSKCALIYVHHDKKGSSERTEQRDRGAGSGILARDYDVGLAVSEHDIDSEAIVIDFLLRNYKHIEPISASWTGNSFIESDLQPVVKTSKRKSPSLDIAKLEPQALELLGHEPMECMAYREKLRNKLGLSHRQERVLILELLETKKIKTIPAVTKMGIPKKFLFDDVSKRNESVNTGDLF